MNEKPASASDSEWSDSLPFQESLPAGPARMSDDESWTDAPEDREEQATDRVDAEAFARIGGPAAARFFGTGDEASTAEALLRHRFRARIGSLAEARRRQYFAEEQKKRHDQYGKAIPEQGVAGLKASWYLSTGMFLLVLAAAAAAAVRLLGALFSTDPLPRSQQMIPGFNGTEALEVLLIAPAVLIPLYLLFHLAVLWRARTHARAALLVAADDHKAPSMGLPVTSPFQGIWASWSFLLKCIEGLLILYVAVVIFAAMLNDYHSWLSLERFETLGSVSPVAWACLLPTIAIAVLAWWRGKIAGRRKELMLTLMYEDN